MKRIFLLLVCVLVLVGCAKSPEQVYSHPQSGKDQLAVHLNECTELADRFGFINMSPVHNYPMKDMKDRVQRQKVFRFCMMKKGYEI